jgi:HK97 family phage portal protein
MFLTKISAAKSITDDFWFNPVGTVTSSGVSVSPDRALALSAVYACVKVLSESVAQLPLQMFKRSGDSTEIARNHYLYNILHSRPNSWQTSFEWREMLVGHVVLRGNAYNRIIFDGMGNVSELIPIHPDSVEIELNENNQILYKVTDKNGKSRIYNRYEIFHIRGLSSDGIKGLSPIEVEREAIGMSLAAQDYGARFYQNDTRPPGWIEYPGNFKDKEQRSNFAASWKSAEVTGIPRQFLKTA